MNIKFSQFKESEKIAVCTTPHCVFVTLNPDDETFEQVVERQEKFLRLSEPIKDKLVSFETAEKIKAIGAHYHLELLQMAPIARVIRSYYFGEVKLEDFAKVISEESKISLVDAQNIARYIIDRIIKKEATVVATTPTVKMTLAQAIEKYPEIQEQLLTSASIEIVGQSARPTVKNWTTDYFNTVGAGNRDVMKRSSYLYHSKNVKSLNATDRQRLSTVLKSLDEGLILKIDTNIREIIFDSAPMPPDRSMSGSGPTKSAVDINRKVEQPIIAKPIVLMPKDGERKAPVAQPVVTERPRQVAGNLPEQRESSIGENHIQHVQGNDWDLKSTHFIKRDEFDNKVATSNDQENIKFSSPQQLPVEKEKDLSKPDFKSGSGSKGEYLKDFFGKIKPIE